jgi:hypothetical protein
MVGKIARCKLGHLTITAVFRHQWDSPTDLYHSRFEFKQRRLGIWWKTSRSVGTTKKGKEMFSEDNMMPSLMVGLNLIWAKCWINFGWKILTLKINKHEETSSTLA